MYLHSLTIKDVKCFHDLTLSFVGENDEVRKWTVLLGENGLGKSTLLQSIAVVLAGPGAVRELLPVAEGWTRNGATHGLIRGVLQWHEGDAQRPRWPKKNPYNAGFAVIGSAKNQPSSLAALSTVPAIVEWTDEKLPSREKEKRSKEMSRLKGTAYAEGKPGWLGCGYGPFRRLSGGSQDADRVLYSGRKAARFVTLFREDAALTSATEWLVSLYNTSKDGDLASERALTVVREALRDNFLLQPVEVFVDARSAQLKVGGQDRVPFGSLSDGYRSMLALGIDLLRWMIEAFPDSNAPLNEHGVVLIDELDAHLHPSWQRQIGTWLRTKFPNLQFIVATHSPFLAQVDPHGAVLLMRENGRVVANTTLPDVAGWRVDQILQELFGLPSVRSPEFEAALKRYMELGIRQRKGILTGPEGQEMKQLELRFDAIQPLADSSADRALANKLRDAVKRRQHQLAELE